jgi:hypothetical protein
MESNLTSPGSVPASFGMMLFLSGNSRADISFAVNQAARFPHAPKKSHGVAVKRIIRYLRGTKDRSWGSATH